MVDGSEKKRRKNIYILALWSPPLQISFFRIICRGFHVLRISGDWGWTRIKRMYCSYLCLHFATCNGWYANLAKYEKIYICVCVGLVGNFCTQIENEKDKKRKDLLEVFREKKKRKKCVGLRVRYSFAWVT